MALQNVDIQITTFVWTINYPNFIQDIYSPNFSVDAYGNMRFRVKLVFESEVKLYSYLSIYLVKEETCCELNPIVFKIKLSVSNNDGDEYFEEETVNFSAKHTILLKRGSSFKKRIKYPPKNALTVRLKIEPTDESVEGSNLLACNEKDLRSLATDLSRALKANRFCDLTFKSIEGKKSVSLHKAVLAARYPNMAAILDLEENFKLDRNLGVDFDAIKMLAEYMYSGILDTGNMTYGLYDLLNRAELEHLERVLYPTPRVIHVSTSVLVKHGSLIWNVPQFSSLQEGTLLISTLCLDSKQEWTKLRIFLYISKNTKNKECLTLKIVRAKQVGKMYMLCKASLISTNDTSYSELYEHVFEHDREFLVNSFERELVEMVKDHFQPNDTLKLYLEFIISDLIETSEYKCKRWLEIKSGQFSPVSANLWTLQRDFKKLQLDPVFSDVVVQVGEELMPAHRVILSARSPVFSEMLDGNTAESETGRVVIDDFSAGVVRCMIRYVYCGELPEDSECVIFQLYRAAHKYQIMQLVKKCSRLVGSVLNTDNVTEALVFSNDYNDKHLKECVRSFVCSNAGEVFESKGWKLLVKERIELTTNIMKAAFGYDQ